MRAETRAMSSDGKETKDQKRNGRRSRKADGPWWVALAMGEREKDLAATGAMARKEATLRKADWVGARLMMVRRVLEAMVKVGC